MSFLKKLSEQNQTEATSLSEKEQDELIKALIAKHKLSTADKPQRRVRKPVPTKSQTIRWNGPKYIIGFPDKDRPYIPYYYVEGQPKEWVQAPRSGHFYYDPIEDTPEFKTIAETVKMLVDKEMGNHFGLGSCHRAWAIKQNILKEQYGIEWHSPAELNPSCRFD